MIVSTRRIQRAIIHRISITGPRVTGSIRFGSDRSDLNLYNFLIRSDPIRFGLEFFQSESDPLIDYVGSDLIFRIGFRSDHIGSDYFRNTNQMLFSYTIRNMQVYAPPLYVFLDQKCDQ